MASIGEYDQVINAVYETLLAPERLAEALSAMTRFLDSDTCHLVGWDRHTFEPTLSVSCSLEVGIGPEYAAHYAGIDPRLKLSRRKAPGATLACHKHFTPSYVSRSELLHDYLLPHAGGHYLLGSSALVPEGPDHVVIRFHRYVGRTHFDEDQIAWFERFMPHLCRALGVMSKQVKARHATTLQGVHDKLSHLAIMALDQTGRLLQANDQATACLQASEPLSLHHGKLIAVDENANAVLRARFAEALDGRATHVAIPRADGSASLCLTLLPAPEEPFSALTNRRMAVVVVACETAPTRVATVAQLMAYFKLTPAEARLTRALCRGEDVQIYAAQEGLKISTVRSHVKSALEKTSTGNQRELVRVVMAIPAVRT